MCHRWNDPRSGELTLAEYRILAEALHELGVYQVSIAGGEPLLRDDIFSIIETFTRHGMCVNVCTNGILLERYARHVGRAGASCITVSLDGASAGCHDAIRGAPGSYGSIESGIRALVACSSSQRPIVRVRMTISNQNLNELQAFYRKWSSIVDDVLLQPVHSCKDAYYTGLGEKTRHLDPEMLAEQLEGTPLARDKYMNCLIASLREYGGFPRQECYAGVLMVRIDPWGNVYPCLEQHVRVGSIREQEFKTIWASDSFSDERKRIASEKNCACWYNNTALIGHYGNLLYRVTGHEVWNRLRQVVCDDTHKNLLA
jgi:MoaA/NifB/PqqE/SkfB family radical SAM enzyme